MYIHDLVKRRNIYINQQAAVVLGYTVEEIQQMGEEVLYKLMHPDDFTQLPAHFQKFANAQDGDIIELEYRMRHRSGEWRWLHSRDIVFARTPDGLPKEILGTAQDISARKKAEEAMRLQTERERLLRAIAQHIRQSLDLGEVLQTAVTEVRQFLHAERAIVFRFQYCAKNNTEPVKEAVVTVESVADDCQSILGTTIPNCCINANFFGYYKHYTIRKLENIYNADAPECHIKTLEKWGVKSSLEVPIWQKENLWGLMMIHQCKAFRQWQTWEIDLIEQLVDQLAIAIQQAELYQQLQAANQELERLASSDGLTQLANRRRFDQYLAKEWRRLEREQAPLSLILCDVDYFKIYNDTYGHQAGDCCLQKVAAALSHAVKRPADLVARYGGEEFAVILPRTEVEGAYQVAEKIRTSVLGLKTPHAGSPINEYVTISLGVASAIPQRGFPPAELIAMADEALYQAKQAGRDRSVCLSRKSSSTAIGSS